MADEAREGTALLDRQTSNKSYRTYKRSSNKSARSGQADNVEDEEGEEVHVNTAFDGDDVDDESTPETPLAAAAATTAATATAADTATYDVAPRGRAVTEDELMFRLRFAHQAPGLDWFDEVANTSRQLGDVGVYERVLTSLRDYPLTMSQKLLLSGQLRARLESGTLTSVSSISALDARGRKRDRQKKNRGPHHGVGWMSRGSVPFGIWDGSIGRIGAYFGTNVASYFQFVRFLTFLNAGIGLIMFLFVSMPQIIPEEFTSDDVKSGFFGELSSTIFFYGAYSNESVTADAGIVDLHYNRPLAYLMTWSCVNILTVMLIVISMYLSYRRIKKTDEDGEEPFSSQIMLGWDFSVTSREGSKIRSSAITTQFKEMLREENVRRRLTLSEKVKLWIVRILINLLSLAVLAGSAYLIYFVAENTIEPGKVVPDVLGDFFKKYQLPLLVSALKVFIPPFLALLLILEKYHPRTQIKLQIARTAVFYVFSLVVFLASIYSVSTQCLSKHSNGTASGQENYCCWENEVGEQLFQIVILDLLVSVLVGVIVCGGRAMLVKCCNYRRFGYHDFNVAGYILDLVYGQSLIWLGLYAAPMFAAVAVVKLIILFYFNYILARTCCVPPAKVFRASRSGTFYLFILLVTLFVCFVPMTYAIIELEPSRTCGPFKTDLHVYEVLTDRIGDSPSWVQDVLEYASTPAVVVPLLIILILLVLYYKAKSSAHKMEAKELRYHLQFERKVEKRKVFARARLMHGISTVSDMDTVGTLRNRGSNKKD